MATTTTKTRPGARTIPGENRVTLRGIDWETYRKVIEAIDEQHVLVAYNQGVLELMSPGLSHEGWKGRLNLFVVFTAMELGMPRRNLGSTLWERPESWRGIEPDECYYLTAGKIAAAPWGIKDTSRYPAPDLAIEVDASGSGLADRPAIYATLGVPEVWRFDGEELHIGNLRDDGTYEPRPESRFLPVRAEEVARWILDDETPDETAWARRLQAWLRAEVAPRLEGRPE